MKRIIIAVLLLVPVVFAQEAPNRQLSQDNYVYHPKAYHIISAVWNIGKDGTRTLNGVRVGEVEKDGSAKMWAAGWAKELGKYDPTLKTSQVYVPAPKNGVAGGYHSASWYRSSPIFLREETILGYQCFTLSEGEWK